MGCSQSSSAVKQASPSPRPLPRPPLPPPDSVLKLDCTSLCDALVAACKSALVYMHLHPQDIGVSQAWVSTRTRAALRQAVDEQEPCVPPHPVCRRIVASRGPHTATMIVCSDEPPAIPDHALGFLATLPLQTGALNLLCSDTPGWPVLWASHAVTKLLLLASNGNFWSTFKGAPSPLQGDGSITMVHAVRDNVVYVFSFRLVLDTDLLLGTLLATEGSADQSQDSESSDEREERGSIDQVKLESNIGKGSFGVVYRAVWRGEYVAVKIIEDAPGVDLSEIRHEVELCERLKHRNVVVTLLSGYRNNPKTLSLQVWIVMELCEQGTLLNCLLRGYFRAVDGMAVDIGRVARVALDIVAGLEYLHSMGIIHRDLTGSNILLTSAYTAKIADFGMSRIVSTNMQTNTHGTITHMPPELLRDGVCSKKTDTYAFGVLLCEMYNGRRAWDGMARGDVFASIMTRDEAPSPAEDAPPEYRALSQACTALDPRARPEWGHVRTILAQFA